MKEFRLNKVFKVIIIVLILAIFSGTYTIGHNPLLVINKSNNDTIIYNDITEILHKVNIDSLLLNEITMYIQKISPKSHNQLPKYLMNAGLEYNIDICFMMAQTQIETNFGTTGIGKEFSKKSLFGVMRSYKYSTYEEAITDYCKILLKNYLGKGKTEQHLMKKYVTHGGARYASNPKYEYELTNAYNMIINKTQIQSLQKQLNDIL